MAIYSVFEPPHTETKYEDALLLRDRFSLFAFLAPLIWFLWHRMWFEALMVVVLSLGVMVLGFLPGGGIAPIVMLLVSLFVGLEARNLQQAFLRRRGWREWGVVVAPNFEQAEMRYLGQALADENREPPLPARKASVFDSITTRYTSQRG